jgi:hypothetical protein
VSLRDVERAMIVFKYFYEKMDIFAPLIEQKQREEEEAKENKDEGMVKLFFAKLANCQITDLGLGTCTCLNHNHYIIVCKQLPSL